MEMNKVKKVLKEILKYTAPLDIIEKEALTFVLDLLDRVEVEKILQITKTCKTSSSGLRTLEDIAQAITNYLEGKEK
jgi:hypothetical protein